MHLANGKHKAIVVDEKTHQQNIVSYIYKIKLTQFYPIYKYCYNFFEEEGFVLSFWKKKFFQNKWIKYVWRIDMTMYIVVYLI